MFQVQESQQKGKDSKLGPKGGISKKQKFQGKCFNYGKQGHKSSDCILSKNNKPKEANVADDISKDVSDIDLTTVIYEMNFVKPGKIRNFQKWQNDNNKNKLS